MQYITQEYTVLYNQDDGEDIVIKPNTPFNAFEGNYKVSSSARIMYAEGRQLVKIWGAGQIITGLGEVPKKPRRRASTLLNEG